MKIAIVLLALLTLALGCKTDFRDCTQTDVSAAFSLPERLSETDLYLETSGEVVNPAAIEFEPRYPLWTDGASKRRWLLLPEGQKVDSSNPDNWSFPVGTQMYKEFVRDGVRVETRLNTHTPAGWTGVSYIWNVDQSDAIRSPEGMVDAQGTQHDVPTAAQCLTCHASRESFVLGFAAIQFDPSQRQQYFEDGVLSAPVEDEPDLPEEVERGLGYLHANCSHCHNSSRSAQVLAPQCFAPDKNFDFSFSVATDAPADATAILTGRAPLGNLQQSVALNRMRMRNVSLDNPSMPPVGTELVDEAGVDALTGLIQYLADNQL